MMMVLMRGPFTMRDRYRMAGNSLAGTRASRRHGGRQHCWQQWQNGRNGRNSTHGTKKDYSAKTNAKAIGFKWIAN